MKTSEVARVLAEMGTMLELRGENPFRCRAYQNAAQALRGLPADLSDMLTDGSLREVPGIGATMFEKIAQLVSTGALPEYDALRSQTPPGLVALLRVPGLGPKKIQALREALQIESLADLRAAAESGQVAAVKGFGPKVAAKVLEGIRFVESVGDRILLSRADRLAGSLLDLVRSQPGVSRAEIAGSVRRRAETVGSLVVVLASTEPENALDRLAATLDVIEILGREVGSVRLRLGDGVRCDFHAVPEAAFAVALHAATGSDDHVAAIRRRALSLGMTLDARQLAGPGGPIVITSEAELFAALGLAEIPPELREGRGEVEAAAAGPLPPLVRREDLRGTFHCHTDWSDGGATLDEMAQAAQALGLEYLGIADHSRSAGYAGGLSIERVRQQWAAIDALNARLGPNFRLFKGIECDILADGSLDYPDDVLTGFDYVVASVHSNFGMSREAMTARIVRAVSHPLVTMLGHPTGRLLLARDAYAVDLDEVIAAAAVSGTMIEINANPHRLDLDDIHARRARDRGVPIAINPDAHSTGGLADLDYGIGQARRAGLVPGDVVNTLPLDEVTSRLAEQRGAGN